MTRDSTVQRLLMATGRQLRDELAAGHPVDLTALDDTEYRGISLGLPAWVDRLAWKTFKKVFHRDPAGGHLRGWNVRMVQDGLDGAWEPQRRRGEPRTFGHYRVIPQTPAHRPPRACPAAAMIDYRIGGNPWYDAMRWMVDPLVALEPGSVEQLLGWSYVSLGPLRLSTPSYFLLLRDVPLTHVHAPPRAA